MEQIPEIDGQDFSWLFRLDKPLDFSLVNFEPFEKLNEMRKQQRAFEGRDKREAEIKN